MREVRASNGCSNALHWSIASSFRSVTQRVGATFGIAPSLVRDVVLIFIISRAMFIALTLIALRAHWVIPSDGADFLRAWGRLDALHYATVSDHGYSGGAQFVHTAFFPLMPLLMRLVSPIVGGNSIVAGIVVANCAYLAAMFGVCALAATDHDTATARRAMLYITLFPAALFLFTGYTESLFLALSVWCLVAIRHHRWWQAGVLGMLAASTRQVGVFLMLPLVLEYLSAIGWQVRKVRPPVLWALLILVGPLLFAAWLWRTVGDPLAFAHAQRFWYRQFAFPWNTLHRVLRELPHQSPTVLLVRGLIDLFAVLLFAGLIIYGSRKWRAGDTVYASGLWLLAICYPSLYWPLLSDTRFMLAEVMCFVLLARLGKNRWLHAATLGVFTALLIVMTLYFFSTQQIL